MKNETTVKIKEDGSIELTPIQKDLFKRYAGKYVKVGLIKSTRTGTQNRALHKFYRNLAVELNLAGLTVQEVLGKAVDVDWTESMVKELIWRRIQKRMLGKDSTTKLNKTEDINNIYEVINRFFSTEYGIHVPFPQKFKCCDSVECICGEMKK